MDQVSNGRACVACVEQIASTSSHAGPRRLRPVLIPALVGAMVLAGCAVETTDVPPVQQHVTWSNYGGGADQSKFVTLSQIDRTNVDQLDVAWFYPTGDQISYPFNPLIAHGVMYVMAKNNSIVALDAATGEEIWIHANLRGLPRRGLNYWESEDGQDRRILIQLNDYLQAIDATTGESILSFGENGLVDLKVGLTPRDPATVTRGQNSTPGTVFEDLIILGSAPGEAYMSAPGHVRAYDVVTGEHVWTFHTVPQPGEYGYDTWPEDAYLYVGGTNVWSEITVDEERGIAYLPLGSPTYDFYGADRVGQNLFGNSLVAVDARTGEMLWYFQAVYHDLRDYDLSSAPQLVTVNHDGQQIDAVAIATKQGFLFAFDRVTGDPLWPIEDRPVPQSHVPGEESWPVQPFPTVLPPFARQEMTSADLSPFLTEEEREEWTERIDELVELGQMGLFTPLSHEHYTLAIPGTTGGTNYGQTAANPDEGLVFLITNDWPSLYPNMELRLPEEPGEGGGGFGGGGGQAAQSAAELVEAGRDLYQQECLACHGADHVGIGAAPSLLGFEARFGLEQFQVLMTAGVGEMPAFTFLEDEEIEAIYRYLGGSPDGVPLELPEGPVVASGGAPGGLLPRPVETRSGGRYGVLYPEEADAPVERYFSQSFGQQYAHIISPPWSSIVAYDLNEGTIRWHRPLGTDRVAAELGGENTGVPETLRNGIVVTSTGLVFSNAKDGHIYAFDQETGEEVWSHELPTGSEGIPAMFEVDGRQYLAVTATTPLRWSRRTPDDREGERGYVVFALPE